MNRRQFICVTGSGLSLSFFPLISFAKETPIRCHNKSLRMMIQDNLVVGLSPRVLNNHDCMTLEAEGVDGEEITRTISKIEISDGPREMDYGLLYKNHMICSWYIHRNRQYQVIKIHLTKDNNGR